MADLGAIVTQLELELGPAAGPPVPLEGGITNRNYSVRFGDARVRAPRAGQATRTCWASTVRPSGWRARRPPGSGSRPALVAAGEGCLVTEFLQAAPIDGRLLRAEPESAAQGAARLPRLGHRAADALLGPGAARRLRADRRPSAAARCRRHTVTPQSLAAQDRGRAAARAPGPCHNDLLPGNILALRLGAGRRAAGRLGVRGDGPPCFDLGNLAINNEFDDATPTSACWRPTSASRPSDGRRAALALMRIMSDAREAAGASCRARSPSSSSTSPTTRDSTSSACDAMPPSDPRLRGVARWRDRVSFPRARGS